MIVNVREFSEKIGIEIERLFEEISEERKKEIEKETEKQGKAYQEELNRRKIFLDDGGNRMECSAFYQGFFTNLVKIDKSVFHWNYDEEESNELESVYSLTLGELAEQLKAMHFKGIVTLFVNAPMHGMIYQIGNYQPYQWCECGNCVDS